MRKNFVALTAAALTGVYTLSGCGSDKLDSASGGAANNAGNSGAQGGKASAGNAGANTSGANSTAGNSAGGSGNVAKGGASSANAGTAGATSCLSADDCPDTLTQVCDSKTGLCVAGQCSSTQLDCGAGKTCVQQADSNVGACYDECEPYVTPCADSSKECVPIFLDDSKGVCISRGTAADGAACRFSQIDTGCSAGDLCVRGGTSLVCRKQCEYFAAAPTCAGSTRCAMGDVCTPLAPDPAKLGELCKPDAAGGTDCGDDGHALRGICGDRGAGLSCFQVCRVDAKDCGANATCTAVFSSIPELGVCFETSACTTGGAQGTTCDDCTAAAIGAGGCCEKQRLNCDNLKACTDLLNCLSACDTDACQTDCENKDGAAGGDTLDAVLGCLYGTSSGNFSGACGVVCQ